MFDSSKVIDEESRIEIKLRKTDDEVPTSWEIGNFIDKLSCYYYKFELINVICKAINEGIHPKNIFILDESFKIDRSYINLDTMAVTDKKIKNLYTIGKPKSIYPNKKLYMLNIIFNIFRECNEILYKRTMKIISRDEIYKFTEQYFIKNIDEVQLISNIVSYGKEKIIEKYEFKEKSEKNKVIDEINIIMKKSKTMVEKFISDKNEFEAIEQTLCSLENNDYNTDIYNHYYNAFFHLMKKIPRPVVGIFYDDTNEIQILSLAQINKNKRNNTFFDIKSISHNSPLAEDVIVGAVSGISTVVKTKNEIDHNNEIHEIQIEQEKLKVQILKKKLEKADVELETTKLRNLEKRIEVMEKKKKYDLKYGGNPALEITNTYLSNQMIGLYNNYQDRSQQLLESNKMEVIDINEVHHIDTHI